VVLTETLGAALASWRQTGYRQANLEQGETP
jgi:hypothetical protein